MEQKPYYPPDLAWVHHTGYSHHVAQVRDGIVTCEAAGALRVLREPGLDACAQASFGHETLPDGLIAQVGARR